MTFHDKETGAGDDLTRRPRAVVYSRVACGEVDDLGVERQREACALHARRTGFDPKVTFHSDWASSGRRLSGRRGLDSLMADVRRGAVDVVIVEDLARIARDLLELLAVYAALRSNRVRLHVAGRGEVTLNEVVMSGVLGLTQRRRRSVRRG